MEFLDLAKSRYSVRKFSDKEIEEDIINKILEAGCVAPTACNNQPIKIIVVKNEKNKISKCTNYHFNAPLFMIVCYDNTQCWKRPFDDKLSGEVDASIITTHLMLEAFSLGIGSTWVMFFDPEKIKIEFNLKDNIIPVSILPMGYPADDASPSLKHTTYKNINDIVDYK